MSSKIKSIQINLAVERGTFTTLFKKFSGEKSNYDFEGISALRSLLSNEKARILHVIKNKTPSSIYALSRILKRDFKSVNEDLSVLKRFGFIDFQPETSGKRKRLKPLLVADSINIEVKI